MTCDDCKADIPPTPKGHTGGTGYARVTRANGTEGYVCYPCANARERADMATAQAYTAYISGDGQRVTTWPGGELARVTYERKGSGGFHNSPIYAYRAVASDGSEWYGRGGGRGMYINLRRRKAAAK